MCSNKNFQFIKEKLFRGFRVKKTTIGKNIRIDGKGYWKATKIFFLACDGRGDHRTSFLCGT